MKPQSEISQDMLEDLVRFRDVSGVPYEDLAQIIRSDPRIVAAKPHSLCRNDPRSGDKAVYSPSRKLRPHNTGSAADVPPEGADSCPICRGDTTSVIDIAPLSEGFTFINENLYPILFPEDGEMRLDSMDPDAPESSGKEAAGVHFVQWASSQHDRDIHNMPREDVIIILERLAVLEKRLLHSQDSRMPPTPSKDEHGHRGYVGLVKNFGRLAGGSISHGHMQIVHTNILPKAIADDEAFLRRSGEPFTSFLLRENPEELLVQDYECVSAVTPYFMKRPLEAIVAVKDVSKSSLHELHADEMESVAAALSDIAGAVVRLMPKLDRELAYNLVFHTGPVGGLYVEVLPLTQVLGGYEKMGLYLCDGLPSQSANMLREEIAGQC